MNCGECCMCWCCSLYGSYCVMFCGTLFREIYVERVEEYKKIRDEYDNIPKQVPINIEMKMERRSSLPTIQEEYEGYENSIFTSII